MSSAICKSLSANAAFADASRASAAALSCSATWRAALRRATSPTSSPTWSAAILAAASDRASASWSPGEGGGGGRVFVRAASTASAARTRSRDASSSIHIDPHCDSTPCTSSSTSPSSLPISVASYNMLSSPITDRSEQKTPDELPPHCPGPATCPPDSARVAPPDWTYGNAQCSPRSVNSISNSQHQQSTVSPQAGALVLRAPRCCDGAGRHDKNTGLAPLAWGLAPLAWAPWGLARTLGQTGQSCCGVRHSI